MQTCLYSCRSSARRERAGAAHAASPSAHAMTTQRLRRPVLLSFLLALTACAAPDPSQPGAQSAGESSQKQPASSSEGELHQQTRSLEPLRVALPGSLVKI